MFWPLFKKTITFAVFTINILVQTEVHESAFSIQTYEYGAHVPGEQTSFRHVGTIPQLNSHFLLNITPNVEGLEKRYTYMRVEYVNAVSNVIINYDPHTHILSLAVVFPFTDTPFGVLGYSMPLRNTDIIISST